MDPQKIRILLIDDHILFREGVVRLLNSEPDFDVIGQCGTVAEAVAILDSRTVDVVLLDADLGGERGSRFVVHCRQRGFQGRILLVTAGVSLQEGSELLRMGIDGVFLKHSHPEELARSIRKVVAGERWIDEKFVGPKSPSAIPRPEKRHLTERERKVLKGVFEGLANKEIAANLFVSESSVKATLQQLFQKTGVRTRGQLVKVALEQYLDQV